jgi:hypothetical protein
MAFDNYVRSLPAFVAWDFHGEVVQFAHVLLAPRASVRRHVEDLGIEDVLIVDNQRVVALSISALANEDICLEMIAATRVVLEYFLGLLAVFPGGYLGACSGVAPAFAFVESDRERRLVPASGAAVSVFLAHDANADVIGNICLSM